MVPHNLVQLIGEGTRTKDIIDTIERVERIAQEDKAGERLNIQNVVFTDEAMPPTTVELSPQDAKEVLCEMVHYMRKVENATAFVDHIDWLHRTHVRGRELAEGVEVSPEQPAQHAA